LIRQITQLIICVGYPEPITSEHTNSRRKDRIPPPMIETNPNQKTIHIEKEQCDKNNLYALYNLNALQSAMLDLKGETFKLWCYLNKNQNGYTLALSKVDALRWGIGSKSSYDRAIAELIQKGYLVNT